MKSLHSIVRKYITYTMPGTSLEEGITLREWAEDVSFLLDEIERLEAKLVEKETKEQES